MARILSLDDAKQSVPSLKLGRYGPRSIIVKYSFLYALIVPAALSAQNATSQGSQWEAQLKKQPDNIDIRSKLIREYFRLSRQDLGAEKSRVAHILWMLAHRPQAAVLGDPVVTVSATAEECTWVEKAWVARINRPARTP